MNVKGILSTYTYGRERREYRRYAVRDVQPISEAAGRGRYTSWATLTGPRGAIYALWIEPNGCCGRLLSHRMRDLGTLSQLEFF